MALVISKMLYHDVVEYVCFQRKESSVDPELCMQDYYYEIQLSRKYNHGFSISVQRKLRNNELYKQSVTTYIFLLEAASMSKINDQGSFG